MYRIAIIEENADAREETHRLAALFFAQRQESVAFVICRDRGDLPEYYDCYLLGDAQSVSILRGSDKLPWKTVCKPLEQEPFFEMLAAWRLLTGEAAVRTPRKRRGCGI